MKDTHAYVSIHTLHFFVWWNILFYWSTVVSPSHSIVIICEWEQIRQDNSFWGKTSLMTISSSPSLECDADRSNLVEFNWRSHWGGGCGGAIGCHDENCCLIEDTCEPLPAVLHASPPVAVNDRSGWASPSVAGNLLAGEPSFRLNVLVSICFAAFLLHCMFVHASSL